MSDPGISRLRDCAARLAAGDLAGAEEALREIDPRHLGTGEKLAAIAGTEIWTYEDLVIGDGGDGGDGGGGARASLFLVPRGDVLPLHDHPGMTVLLRVLAGRLAVRSYDWAADHPGSGLARRTADRVVAAADPVQALHPGQGSLHRIEALEDTVFLDVFAPYYSDEDGRPCTYYQEDGTVEAGREILVRLAVCPWEETEARGAKSAPPP